MSKITAKEKAIQLIGNKNTELLEQQGIKISWLHEYALKEFALAATTREDILREIHRLENLLNHRG